MPTVTVGRENSADIFDGSAVADTPAWMKGFLDHFYNADTLLGTLVGRRLPGLIADVRLVNAALLDFLRS